VTQDIRAKHPREWIDVRVSTFSMVPRATLIRHRKFLLQSSVIRYWEYKPTSHFFERG